MEPTLEAPLATTHEAKTDQSDSDLSIPEPQEGLPNDGRAEVDDPHAQDAKKDKECKEELKSTEADTATPTPTLPPLSKLQLQAIESFFADAECPDDDGYDEIIEVPSVIYPDISTSELDKLRKQLRINTVSN